MGRKYRKKQSRQYRRKTRRKRGKGGKPRRQAIDLFDWRWTDEQGRDWIIEPDGKAKRADGSRG